MADGLETFLERARERERPLPWFVERELRGFLACGIHAHENISGLFPGPCGNNELNAFETCDPPGSAAGGNGNLCRADCTVCGDTVVDPGEDCDDGNGVDAGDQCSNACTSSPQAAGRFRTSKR